MRKRRRPWATPAAAVGGKGSLLLLLLLATLQQSGAAYQMHEYDKWYYKTSNNSFVAAGLDGQTWCNVSHGFTNTSINLGNVLKGRRISVAFDKDHPMVEYDEASGNFTGGYMVDVMQLVAKSAGFEILPITVDHPDFEAGDTWDTWLTATKYSADVVGIWFLDTAKRRQSGTLFPFHFMDSSLYFATSVCEANGGVAFMSFSRPFSSGVWLLSGLALLGTALLILIFEGARFMDYQRKEEERNLKYMKKMTMVAIGDGIQSNALVVPPLTARNLANSATTGVGDGAAGLSSSPRGKGKGKFRYTASSAAAGMVLSKKRTRELEKIEREAAAGRGRQRAEKERGGTDFALDHYSRYRGYVFGFTPRAFLKGLGYSLYKGAQVLTYSGSYLPKTKWGKLLAWSWSFLVLVLIATYTANLTSFLLTTSGTTYCAVSSMTEAVVKDLPVCVREGSAPAAQARTIYPTYDKFVSTAGEEMFQSVRDGTCVGLVATTFKIASWQASNATNEYCDMEVAGSLIQEFGGSFVVQNDITGTCTSIVSTALAFVMHSLQESGDLRRIYRSYIADINNADCEAQRSNSELSDTARLSGGDLAGLFLVHALLLLVSGLIYCTCGLGVSDVARLRERLLMEIEGENYKDRATRRNYTHSARINRAVERAEFLQAKAKAAKAEHEGVRGGGAGLSGTQRGSTEGGEEQERKGSPYEGGGAAGMGVEEEAKVVELQGDRLRQELEQEEEEKEASRWKPLLERRSEELDHGEESEADRPDTSSPLHSPRDAQA